MGITGWWQWLIVLVIVLLLFGRGKIPELMGDLGKGVRNLKKGLKEETNEAADAGDDAAKTVEHQATETVDPVKSATKES
ncbi:MAG: twin-arginine translocase TatA/TatE family subunit [Pseudomonadota bacterium]